MKLLPTDAWSWTFSIGIFDIFEFDISRFHSYPMFGKVVFYQKIFQNLFCAEDLIIKPSRTLLRTVLSSKTYVLRISKILSWSKKQKLCGRHKVGTSTQCNWGKTDNWDITDSKERMRTHALKKQANLVLKFRFHLIHPQLSWTYTYAIYAIIFYTYICISTTVGYMLE